VTTAESAISWERRAQSLKLTVGDYCFGQFRFEAMVSDAPLTHFLDHPASLAAIRESIGDKRGAFVVRSFPAEKALPRISFAGNLICYVPIQYQRYFIVFENTFRDYLSKFSAKSRSTLKRKIQKFRAHSGGTLDWRQYRAPAEMEEFYLLADALSKKTYQERLLREGFADSAPPKDLIASLAQCDAVRGYLLFYDGQAVAYVFCPCHAKTILYSAVGFDPAYRQFSPGDVLLYLLIEKLFEEREFRFLDFGEGEAWYKSFFSTGSARCARIYCFPMTFANVVAVVLHTLSQALSTVVGATLDAVNLRSKIRGLLRRRAVVRSSSALGKAVIRR
jgi:CelD/BcsL family acetyltransferase involved in cellulose biosynthesis